MGENSEQNEPLANPQHEKFAQLIASGVESQEAYSTVFTNASKASANSAGPRLFAKVRPRVRWLQSQSATATTLNMQERREFLARAVRIKLHELDLTKDGDLVQEIDYRGEEEGGGIKKLKLPGKRECVMDDAKLAGELVDKSEVKVTMPVSPADILAAQRRMPELQGLC